MKSSIVALTVTLALATSALAAPQPEVEKRADNCYFPSVCWNNWGGKCEDYCGDRKFSHMTGDGCRWFYKKLPKFITPTNKVCGRVSGAI
ncbi:hypothetical protein BGZ82_007836 [Podila clonocystis]|nr:hypothetical protein BGZ82_007836 [Podila clonocystis]